MSPWSECYITSPFMEMNRLETGVTHAEEVSDKGLLGCSVNEMWSLNCTFSSRFPTFVFSRPKTSENKNQEFGTLISLSIMPIYSTTAVQHSFRFIVLQ